MQDKGARQLIGNRIGGRRHMVDKQAQDARHRDFKKKTKLQDLLWM